MKVCVKCKIEMQSRENGIGVRFGESHVYCGDKFQCPICNFEVIVTSNVPTFDPEKRILTLQMP